MQLILYTADCVGNAKNCKYPRKAVVTSADELQDAVSTDHVCAQYQGNYRSVDNFISSNVVVMDCDNDHSEDPSEWITPEKLEEIFSDVAYGLAPSRHNLIEKDEKAARPKFHVYFEIEEVVDAGKYAALKRAIFKEYPFFDGNALDAGRFLFGSSAGEAVWHDAWMTIDALLGPVEGGEDDFQASGVIPSGQRNNSMNLFAGKVLKRYGETEKAYKVYLDRAAKCDPPLEEEELKTIWYSALKFYRKKVKTDASYVAPDAYNDEFAGESLKPDDYSDIGQAKVVAREYGGELKYTDATDYLRYNGEYWMESKQQAVAVMEDFLDLQLTDALDQMESAKKALIEAGIDERIVKTGGKALEKEIEPEHLKLFYAYLAAKQYLAFVMKRRDMKYVTSALMAAKPMLSIDVSSLDGDEFLLNVPGATFDLRDTSSKAPDPDDYITKQTLAAPGDEGMDKWLASLNLFFCNDKSLIDYVQQIVGMAAIGKVYMEALIIAYGEGSNGKSTFWNSISRVLGTYSGNISADALTVGCKRNVKPEMAELKGKRLVVAAELEEGQRLNTSIVKQITDLQIDGETIDENTGLKDFNRLTSDERVNYVIKQMEYYGYCGKKPKGLIFCSSKKEACILSEKFNERGYKTLALTGDDSQERREQAVERLVLEDGADKLDYILTVDIFNEGVDIPEVNQIIMLRPTQSPIIFVQQLGRGLRKAENKDYVVILDFIGNYKNNFMIPIALSGDRSYNKDNIRRYVLEGERIIPGSSTIHFDEISKKRIFSAIDSANFSDIRLIKENYRNLKNKLGHIPALKDFDDYGEMDILRIFDNSSLGSYYKFLVKYEKEYTVRFSPEEEKVIEFISKKLASGKRIHELAMLNRILVYRQGFFQLWKKDLSDTYGIELKDKTVKNVVNVMTNKFQSGSGKKTYSDCVFLDRTKAGDYEISPEFEKMLENPEFYEIIKELIEFGVSRYKENYSCRYQDTNFVLYQKYTYEDVCRLLEWENNEVPLNLGGYKYDRKTKTFPVFINYDKEEDIQDTIKYEDHFESPSRLIAISKQSRTKESEDVQNFLHAKERGIDVELFVRKNKDDKISKEFYYLGRMTATGKAEEFIMANTDKTAVEIEWQLDTPVREDIYEYIVNT